MSQQEKDKSKKYKTIIGTLSYARFRFPTGLKQSAAFGNRGFTKQQSARKQTAHKPPQSSQGTDASNDNDIDMPPSRSATPGPIADASQLTVTPAATDASIADTSQITLSPGGSDFQQSTPQHFPSTKVLLSQVEANTQQEVRPALFPFRRNYINVIVAVKKYAPFYVPTLLEFGEIEFEKYFKRLCIDHGVIQLTETSYCMRVMIKNKLSVKHYWHCAKARGSEKYVCDCLQWKKTDKLMCVHTLICHIADNYEKMEQPMVAIKPNSEQQLADNVVYLGTFRPGL